MAERSSMSSVAVEVLVQLVPGVGAQLATLWRYAQERDAERVEQTVLAARGCLDSDEEFLRRLGSSERLLDLLRQAVEASRRTEWAAKRRTLGRLAGKAMVDDAELEPTAALLIALAGLESQDIRELVRVRTEIGEAPRSGMPRVPIVAEPWRSHLIAHGCLDINYGSISPVGGAGSGGQWIAGVSSFGELLLTWLAEADDGPTTGA